MELTHYGARPDKCVFSGVLLWSPRGRRRVLMDHPAGLHTPGPGRTCVDPVHTAGTDHLTLISHQLRQFSFSEFRLCDKDYKSHDN